MSDADWGFGRPSMTKTVQKGQKLLYISVMQPSDSKSPWVAFAVETGSVQKMKKAKSIVDAANIALDDHSHDIIGSSQKLSVAIKLAETYASKWLKKSASSKKCPCKAIEK